ncbi:hypothetical protein LPJ57_007407, partial [Coemansia sp. RSA 486]
LLVVPGADLAGNHLLRRRIRHDTSVPVGYVRDQQHEQLPRNHLDRLVHRLDLWRLGVHQLDQRPHQARRQALRHAHILCEFHVDAGAGDPGLFLLSLCQIVYPRPPVPSAPRPAHTHAGLWPGIPCFVDLRRGPFRQRRVRIVRSRKEQHVLSALWQELPASAFRVSGQGAGAGRMGGVPDVASGSEQADAEL